MDSGRNMRGLRTRRDLLILLAVIAGVGLAVFFIPVMDGPGSHQRVREAVAVGNFRLLRERQEAFAASNPRKGYACQLQVLKPSPPPNQGYDPYGFLIQDSYAGYRISLQNCAPDADGVVRTYQAVAVPVNPGVSGNRAFCLDEQGIIWFDAKGSAATCFSSRKPID